MRFLYRCRRCSRQLISTELEPICPTCGAQCDYMGVLLVPEADFPPRPTHKVACSMHSEQPADDMLVDEAPARLVAVEIPNLLHGVQYVNLPREETFVDETTQHLDRLGRRISVKVRFDQPGVHAFQLKLVADKSNADYSSEQPNELFQYQTQVFEGHTDANGEKVVEGFFYVAIAGADAYWFEGRDQCGTQAHSDVLRTARLIYCQPVVTTGVQEAAARDLTDVCRTYEELGIKIVLLPEVYIDPFSNFDENNTTERDRFFGAIKQCTHDSAKLAHTLVLVYAPSLASRETAKFTIANVKFGDNRVSVSDERATVENCVLTFKLPNKHGAQLYLWKGLDEKKWFLGSQFVPNVGAPVGIDEVHWTAKANDPSYPDQCRSLKINLKNALAGAALDGTATGKIEVGLAYTSANHMPGGLAYPYKRVCIIATKALWSTVIKQRQLDTITHEIGHKIGLVPSGSGLLKSSETYYDKPPHKGPHCRFGVEPQHMTAELFPFASGKCVMFGAPAPNHPSYPSPPFCKNCRDAVRKTVWDWGNLEI